MQKKKGFTLIELLIVIAILVILAVVVILTLNPAQLLAQARDSQRMSDMSTLKSAISLYLADVATSSPNCGMGNSNIAYISAASVTATSVVLARYPISSSTMTVITTSTPKNINGSGWIPINFTLISSGAPIGSEPIDPVNTLSNNTSTSYFYAFAISPSSTCAFQLSAHMESQRYQYNGPNSVEGNGNYPYDYQTGTAGGM
jgi:prepilin-type N-terminal cleavage/methylation domain-containing protein